MKGMKYFLILMSFTCAPLLSHVNKINYFPVD
jgi:hypothetical protein